MIKPGTVCRVVRIRGFAAGANGRFVQVKAGTLCSRCCQQFEYDFVEPIVLAFPSFGGAHITGAHEQHLQPISDPPTCALTDAQVYRRGPRPLELPQIERKESSDAISQHPNGGSLARADLPASPLS